MTKISFEGKKVIIFDLDGTIVNLTADWMTLRDVLVEKYREIYEEQCDFERISKCLDNIVEKKDEEVLVNFFDIIRHYELENIKDTQLIEETIFFINHKKSFGIKNEIKFAVLSLNTRNSIIQSLEIANIHNKIDLIIGREDVRRWKPAPDGLLKIQKHYKVSKKEMIFFGDLENDLLTGKNAGIEAYFIDDLIKLVNKLKKGHY
ncbi:MAG: HAD hydrolase-like protein [Candidatus Lokiarchaeota archaeon]|nr:HAD hydrolase-like protein [Candidatus Lokiarchaeota archaeon]